VYNLPICGKKYPVGLDKDKFKNYTRQEQTTTTDKGWCGGGRLTAPGIPEVLGMSFVSSCWPQQAVVPVQTVHG
jgi:hypothetical protein